MDFGLTEREKEVFAVLCDAEVASEKDILVTAFGYSPDLAARIKTRAVAMTISRIRKKIPFTIETIRGLGYRLLVG